MKCVGAEDGQKQCQRCKRAGQEYVFCSPCLPQINVDIKGFPARCVFEKHRRGRKPGSKYIQNFFPLIEFLFNIILCVQALRGLQDAPSSGEGAK